MANRKVAISGDEYIRIIAGNGVEYDVSPAQLAQLLADYIAEQIQGTEADATAALLASLHLYGAGAPVDYTDGTPPATGEGVALKGALYSDITAGLVYRNSGSQAQPIWTKLADAIA